MKFQITILGYDYNDNIGLDIRFTYSWSDPDGYDRSPIDRANEIIKLTGPWKRTVVEVRELIEENGELKPGIPLTPPGAIYATLDEIPF